MPQPDNQAPNHPTTSTDEHQLLPKPIHKKISYRQARALEKHYQQYWSWLQDAGKDPDRNVGFAPGSVHDQFHRTTQFHQWVWNQTGTISTRFTHAHANEYEQALDENRIQTEEGNPYAEGSKRKLQQAVINYFEFKVNCFSGEPWTPRLTFTQSEYNQSDYFTLDERDRLYEASLTYDDLGKYNDLSPEERARQKQYLAQKLGKPKSEVGPTDFEACRTSWKIPSLVSVSLDLGARPVFISRCSEQWYKPEKGVFQIPKEASPKNDVYWEPGLSSRSIQMMDWWADQRAALSDYDNVETLWLNREGNSYRSDSLNYLLNRLIEEAGIDQSDRKLTWMSIRRSTGTYLTYFRSLAYAKEQLRHKSRQSTLRYVEIPVEARQNALNQLGEGSIATSEINQPSSPEGGSISSPEARYDG